MQRSPAAAPRPLLGRVARLDRVLLLTVALAACVRFWRLGAQALWGATRGNGPRGSGPVARRPIPPRQALRQGLITNLGNPKIAVFFTSFLPQFTPAHHASFGTLVLLGALFCVIGLSWLTAYTFVVARIGDFLRRPRPRRILEGVTGGVLVAFGARLAFEHR